MTNITQKVWDFLNKNPFIVKGLDLNLINVRALSLFILNNSQMDASLHAVMSGVRRYEKEMKKGDVKLEQIEEVFRDSKISTKSRLLMFKVKRHFDFLKNLIPDILDSIHVSKGEVLRIVEGRESIKFIVDNSKKNEIRGMISNDELVELTEDLGEINVHLSDKYGDMPGLISPILNELAANEINLIEVIGCMPELILIVREEDISKCHDAILRFFYGKR
jgi:hypothetical protein